MATPKIRPTPGPWTASAVSSAVGSLVSYGDCTQGKNVCAVMPQRDALVTKANAQLIAASPDMLEALQEIVNWCQSALSGGNLPNTPDEDIEGQFEGILELAEKAIAKATEVEATSGT